MMIRRRVEQQQVLADDAVFERRGERRQCEQKIRRHRRQRLVFRILRVDLERHRPRRRRVVLEDRFRVTTLFALQLGREETTEHGADCLR